MKNSLRSNSTSISAVLFLIVAVAAVLSKPLSAQDQISVSSCPGGVNPPLTLAIDCSHVTSAEDKKLCRPFIENQACKVFPVYRKITGINLEDTCKEIKFTIYEDANWPHPKGEGGLALHCAVDYLSQYSIKSHQGKLGPYDVHELLHEYQLALGALPDAHVLFSSSMAEAIRGIGDQEQYDLTMKRMKEESERLHQELESGKYKGRPDECKIAQTQVDESLYLENSRAVYAYYRKLGPDKAKDMASRQARFSRMLWVVSGPKPEVKQFLIEHGCSKF